jgi:ribosomal protein S18 acetylase RimI-like enzyme
MRIRTYRPEDRAALLDLWRRCDLLRPWNDPVKDIERKLAEQPGGLFVGEDGGEMMASMMVGYDGHRGWLNYLAVCPRHRRRGHGRTLMAHAEGWLHERGCPKINLQVRAANHPARAFYHALGFQTDEVVSLGKRLVHDHAAAPAALAARTPRG